MHLVVGPAGAWWQIHLTIRPGDIIAAAIVYFCHLAIASYSAHGEVFDLVESLLPFRRLCPPVSARAQWWNSLWSVLQRWSLQIPNEVAR